MHPETLRFNQRLVISALGNIEAWEQWTEKVPTGQAKALNLSLIRLVKGLVKAWRLYLAELRQQQLNPEARQIGPPSNDITSVLKDG